MKARDFQLGPIIAWLDVKAGGLMCFVCLPFLHFWFLTQRFIRQHKFLTSLHFTVRIWLWVGLHRSRICPCLHNVSTPDSLAKGEVYRIRCFSAAGFNIRWLPRMITRKGIGHFCVCLIPVVWKIWRENFIKFLSMKLNMRHYWIGVVVFKWTYYGIVLE